MTLMPRFLFAQQGTVGTPVRTPAEDFRLAMNGLYTPAGAALQARGGVLPGFVASGATRPVDVLTPSASTLTIKPGHFIVQGSTGNQGAYIGVVDSDTTRTIAGGSLPGAGQFKAGYVIAHAYDSFYGDAQDGFDLEVLLGTAAASSGSAPLPSVPTNSLILKNFTINSAGAITLGSVIAPFVTARGGIPPIVAGDTTNGVYKGQYRDNPATGLERWDGAAWQPLGLGGDTGWVSLGVAAPPVAGANGCHYRMKNGVVDVQLDVSYNGVFATNYSIVTLPAGARPSIQRYYQGAWYGNGPVVTIVVNTNGVVQISQNANSSQLGLVASFSFIAG